MPSLVINSFQETFVNSNDPTTAFVGSLYNCAGYDVNGDGGFCDTWSCFVIPSFLANATISNVSLNAMAFYVRGSYSTSGMAFELHRSLNIVWNYVTMTWNTAPNYVGGASAARGITAIQPGDVLPFTGGSMAADIKAAAVVGKLSYVMMISNISDGVGIEMSSYANGAPQSLSFDYTLPSSGDPVWHGMN